MNKMVSIIDIFKEEISVMGRDPILLITNFLLLEKLNKIKEMSSRSFEEYLSKRNINSSKQSTTEIKKQMINDLVNKSELMENHGLFVLRSELNRLLSYFKDDVIVQKKLMNFVIN